MDHLDPKEQARVAIEADFFMLTVPVPPPWRPGRSASVGGLPSDDTLKELSEKSSRPKDSSVRPPSPSSTSSDIVGHDRSFLIKSCQLPLIRHRPMKRHENMNNIAQCGVPLKSFSPCCSLRLPQRGCSHKVLVTAQIMIPQGAMRMTLSLSPVELALDFPKGFVKIFIEAILS